MKNLMWIQSENFGGSDYYFCDGKLIESSNQSLQMRAVQKLYKAQCMRECLSSNNLKLRQERGYANFTLAYSLSRGFLFKSAFNEYVGNRHRGFVYWCRYSDLQNLWSVINTCATSLGYTIDLADQPLVTNYIKKIRLRRRLLLVSVVSSIFFIIILL